jgi:hypothetical protein
MTRRPRKAKVLRKASRKAATPAKPAKQPQHDALDDLIIASARALDLTIDKTWMPAVRGNLVVTLRLAALVSSFALPDDAEPAPVFKA